MAKDRAATSSSHIPAKTTSGSSLDNLEHYSHAWNAADFGMLDGQYQLGPTTMSQVGLPPPNTQPDSPIGLGYRMFNLKASMLDVDRGLEVSNPNHLLLHAYLVLPAKSTSTISPRDPDGAKSCSIWISQEADFAR
jgi:hypothetical protein